MDNTNTENTNVEGQRNNDYVFSPKELEHKSRREQAYREARNAEAPLGPRTKAWFNVIGEGALEMMEGAKREYSNNSKKENQNNGTEENLPNNEQRDEIYDNEANRNEHLHREKRRQLWNEANDSNSTLTTRTKAGTGAVVAAAKELFEGGKKEFENKKQQRNKKTRVNENSETEKIPPTLNPDYDPGHPSFPDVPETDHTQTSFSNRKQSPEYAHCSSAEENNNSINLDKDDVMRDFHKSKEDELMQKRRVQASVARDPTLPLSERMKAGGSAFISATKELSEGARREFREKNKKEKVYQ